MIFYSMIMHILIQRGIWRTRAKLALFGGGTLGFLLELLLLGLHDIDIEGIG